MTGHRLSSRCSRSRRGIWGSGARIGHTEQVADGGPLGSRWGIDFCLGCPRHRYLDVAMSRKVFIEYSFGWVTSQGARAD